MIIVQMHGEPGSGKSTLARTLGPRIDAIALDKDIFKTALLEAGVPEATAGRAAYDVYFDVARSLVRQNCSLIMDNPVFWPSVEHRWLALADLAGSPRLLIECICPDRAELIHRLTTRHGLASQPRGPLVLDRHSGAAPTEFQPRLTLDTTRPLAEIVDEAEQYVLAGVPA